MEYFIDELATKNLDVKFVEYFLTKLNVMQDCLFDDLKNWVSLLDGNFVRVQRRAV